MGPPALEHHEVETGTNRAKRRGVAAAELRVSSQAAKGNHKGESPPSISDGSA